MLFLACTGVPDDSGSTETADTDTGERPPPPSPHRLLLLDVGGRLAWEDGWSLSSQGGSTGILYTDTEPIGLSEHCRLSNRADPLTAGVSPIRLSTSIERIAGHWNGEAYDMLGFEGQEVFAEEDTLRAYNEEEGLDLSISTPASVDPAQAFGPPDGLDTAILVEAELVWTGIWGGDVALMCAVPSGDRLLPEEGQELLGDTEPEFIKVVLATAARAEGFFAEPVWLIAGRSFDVGPGEL